MHEKLTQNQVMLARQLRLMGMMLRQSDTISPEDKRHIEERLHMYDDLMEKDPEMIQLREKYKAEGLAEGEIKTLRTVILIVVKGRFPSLVEQAQKKVARMRSAKNLLHLFEQLLSASDEVAVRTLLTL